MTGGGSKATVDIDSKAGNPAPPLRLVQFTDLHLFGDPGARLLGQNTNETFAQVLRLARSRHWPPDAILLTGDLVHDESPAGYRLLRQCLDALCVPCHCIPGNHDRVDLLADHLDPAADLPPRIVPWRDWDLILLDSTLPNEDGGHLPLAVLDALDRYLGVWRTRPALVCLHHQPVPMGSHWLDTMMVDNGHRLIALAERHGNLRGILWGHVHQQLDARHEHCLLLATPATCIQFQPGTDDFRLDPRTPGYRWLELHADGRIDTGVERIAAYPEPLVLRSDGY